MNNMISPKKISSKFSKITSMVVILSLLMVMFQGVTAFALTETQTDAAAGTMEMTYSGSGVNVGDTVTFKFTSGPGINGGTIADGSSSGFSIIDTVNFTTGVATTFTAKYLGANGGNLVIKIDNTDYTYTFTNVNPTSINPVKINKVTVNPSSTITKGQDGLSVDIVLENTDVTNGADVSLELKGGSFTFKDGAMSKKFNIAKDSTRTVNYNVKYDGLSKDMVIDFSYLMTNISAGTAPTKDTYTAYISNAKIYVENPTSSSTPNEPDKDPGEFNLITTSEIPTLYANGSLSPFLVKVKNVGTAAVYTANANLLSTTEGLEGAFRNTTSGYLTNTVGSILAGDSSSLRFSLNVPDTVKSGYYTLNINVLGKVYNGKLTSVALTQKVYVDNPKLPISTPETPVASAKVSVTNIALSTKTPTAGKEFTLSLTVTNTGKRAAKNIEVSLGGLISTGIYSTDVAYKNISSIEAGKSKTVTFKMMSNKTIDTGVSAVTANIKYNDEKDEAKTATSDISIPIKGASPSFVEFFSMKTNKNLYEVGEIATVSINVKNSGIGTINNGKLWIEGFAGNTATLLPGQKENTAMRNIGSVSKNQVKSNVYKLKISENATSDVISLKTVFSYTDEKGVPKTIESTVFIFVNAKKEPGEEGATNTPRIIIQKYKLDVDTVNAGKPFNFTFTLKNTSKKLDVVNMKVSVSSTDGIFTPVEGSSTFFIEELKKGSTQEMNIALTTKIDAETKSYPIIVAIEYEDSKAKPYTATENINLRVLQPQVLEFNNVNIPESGDMNMGIPVMFNYINKGKTPLLNFNITFEGDFNVDQKENFLGNIAAGNMDSFETTIMPNAEGPLTGKIIISYEDAVGNITKKELPIKAEVMGGGGFDPGGGMVDPDKPAISPDDPVEGGISIWIYIAIGGGVLLIAAAAFVIIRRRKKAKKELLEDEED